MVKVVAAKADNFTNPERLFGSIEFDAMHDEFLENANITYLSRGR
jgi:hypothetical protein